MKVLIIGGNRFVGLRLSHVLDKNPDTELHVLNRTGQVAHTKNAIIHKGDRRNLAAAYLDKDWDAIIDMAGFTREDAETALGFFTRVKRYIFISTMSVYDLGADLKEESFDPKTYSLETPFGDNDPGLLYQFGKRQAEAVLAQQAPFPVLLVRFPLLVGPDDYTHRFAFHVERIAQSKPIFLPNPAVKISAIHAEDAAGFLNQTLNRDLTGPLNVAAPDTLSLKDLIHKIEQATGKKALLINHKSAEADSPYGAQADYTMDTSRLQAAGFKIRPIQSWLGDLIEIFSDTSRSRMH
jgi:nucleoside-diphosphate-sugar epimerase